MIWLVLVIVVVVLFVLMGARGLRGNARVDYSRLDQARNVRNEEFEKPRDEGNLL